MIACVQIPYFAATVEQASQSHDLRSQPLIVRTPLSQSARGQVYGVDTQAAMAGVTPGMPLAQAKLLCPDAMVISANPSKYRTALESLIETLHLLSLKVEIEGYEQPRSHRKEPQFSTTFSTATFYLELERPSKQACLVHGRALLQQLCDVHGFRAVIGVGLNKFTAYVAAHLTTAEPIRYVPRQATTTFLASQSVYLLPLQKDLALRFQRLGIRTLGAFGALPAEEIRTQFGPHGPFLYQLARGEDNRLFTLTTIQKPIRHRQPFDEPVHDTLEWGRVLRQLADVLVVDLSERSALVRQIKLTITDQKEGVYEKSLIFRRLTADAKHIAETLEAIMRRFRLRCGVVLFDVMVLDYVVRNAPEQLDLFANPELVSNKHQLLDELQVRFGTGCICRVRLTNPAAYVPEQRFVVEAIEAR